MEAREGEGAAALQRARAVLLGAGAADLVPRPWQSPRQPAGDCDLVRFAAWRAADPDVEAAVLLAGLRLLGSARAEMDQMEAALLFAARAAGLTWPQIAGGLSLGSPQAAQQRLGRIASRASAPGDAVQA